MKDESNIGDRVKQVLEIKGLTGTELANLAEVSSPVIYRTISGDSLPNFPFFFNLCKAMPDLNVDWLITGRGEPFGEPVKEVQVPMEGDPKTFGEAQIAIIHLRDKIKLLQDSVGKLEEYNEHLRDQNKFLKRLYESD
ncbi:MAG: helix-turn-helix transcriptional regulator [Bacteroidota bacterium]